MHELNIQELKSRIDIIGLIESAGIMLKKHGNEFTGLCPFHKDTKPSLCVNPQKQLFYCFGCGAGGDVITFTELIYGTDFKGALDILSKYMGCTLDIQHDSWHSRNPNIKNRIFDEPASYPNEVNYLQKSKNINRVVEIYHHNLFKNRDALQYLNARGITGLDIIDQFKIGYCNGRLLMNLHREDVEYRVLKDIGIFREMTDTGYVFEHFKGYLTFPFFDDRGNVGEIYGRRIDGSPDYKHKYLQGKHAGVFNPEGIQSSAEIFLCECVLDSLSLAQMGIFNTTCTFGKGVLTDELIAAISKYSERVYLCHDNDSGDDRCAYKTADILSGQGIEVARVILPEDIKDVNEFLTANLAKGLPLSEIRREFEGLNKMSYAKRVFANCA